MDDKTNNKNIIINQLKQNSKNEEFMLIKKITKIQMIMV